MHEEDVVRLYKEMAPGITAKIAYWLSKMEVHDNIEQLAEDLVEEAFELVLRAARRNHPITYSEKSFVWYRVRKVWNRFIEKRKKQGFISNELFEELYQAEDTDPCEMLIETEQRQSRIELIPDNAKPIVDLLNKGYSYEEVRVMDNKQPGAFRTLIYRIRKLFP